MVVLLLPPLRLRVLWVGESHGGFGARDVLETNGVPVAAGEVYGSKEAKVSKWYS